MELTDELRKVTAERDRLLLWLVGFANATQKFDLYGPDELRRDSHRWWVFDGQQWQHAPTALGAVRKAAGLDQEEETI